MRRPVLCFHCLYSSGSRLSPPVLQCSTVGNLRLRGRQICQPWMPCWEYKASRAYGLSFQITHLSACSLLNPPSVVLLMVPARRMPHCFHKSPLIFLTGSEWVMLKMLGPINDVLVMFGCNKETRILIRTHTRKSSYGSKRDNFIDHKWWGMRPQGTLGCSRDILPFVREGLCYLRTFSISVWRLKVRVGKGLSRTSRQGHL